MSALFSRWPELQGRLPHMPLANLPTPVERLDPPLGAGVRAPGAGLWIKRDDISGHLYGGNKVRKLEFILADALQRGAEVLWTVGAVGSHHALACALYGQAHGLKVHIVHFPQPPNTHVQSVLSALSATDAQLHLTRHASLMPLAMARTHASLSRRHPRKVAFVPPGGSNTLGTIGYVAAAIELADQIAAGLAPQPARIYVPVGSTSTFAGLWLGCKLAGLKTEVIGVRVVDLVAANALNAARLIRSASALLHAAAPSIPLVDPDPGALQIRHGYFGQTYGASTRRGDRATHLFASMGHDLDPTYTAKVAAGLLDELNRPNLRPLGPVLFWQTLSSITAPPGDAASLSRLPPAYKAFLAHQERP